MIFSKITQKALAAFDEQLKAASEARAAAEADLRRATSHVSESEALVERLTQERDAAVERANAQQHSLEQLEQRYSARLAELQLEKEQVNLSI